MLNIESSGTNVVVTLKRFGKTLIFEYDAGNELVAEFAADSLRADMWALLEKIEKQAYDRGWTDKMKRRKKNESKRECYDLWG